PRDCVQDLVEAVYSAGIVLGPVPAVEAFEPLVVRGGEQGYPRPLGAQERHGPLELGGDVRIERGLAEVGPPSGVASVMRLPPPDRNRDDVEIAAVEQRTPALRPFLALRRGVRDL